MASAARVFLLLALVAMLVAGAFADRALLKSSSTSKKTQSKYGLKKACKKEFSGCKKCKYTDDEDETVLDIECTACKGKNTEVDEDTGKCACSEFYGTMTKTQYKDYNKAQKEGDKKTTGALVCGGGGGGGRGGRRGGAPGPDGNNAP